MELEKLKKQLLKGLSYRKIASLESCSPKKIEYWVNKLNLRKFSKFNKLYKKDVIKNYFEIIDTKEKAYIVGFLIGDGTISKKFDVSLSLSIKDKTILSKIKEYIPWECGYTEDLTLNEEKRKFPRARLRFRNRQMGKDLVNHYEKRLSSERKSPILNNELEKYFLSGFLDADGCITWGYRENGNRYNKVSFTASKTILKGIQKILRTHNIHTQIKPKEEEKVEIIEFSNERDIIKLHKLLPQDSIRLERKVNTLNSLINIFKNKNK